MSLRVLVCGGRDFNDRARAFAVLDRFRARFGVAWVIHGAQRGADTLAEDWAKARGVEWVSFPADWKELGPSAGPARNAAMLKDGRPEAVIAFPGGKGTANMVKQASEAGVKVYEIPATL